MPAKLRLALLSLTALSLSYVAVRHVAVYASSFAAPVEGPGSSTSTRSMSKNVSRWFIRRLARSHTWYGRVGGKERGNLG